MFRSILIIFNFKKLHDFPFIFKLSCTKLEFQLSFCMIKCSFSPYGKSLLLPFIVVMEKIYSGQLYKQTK